MRRLAIVSYPILAVPDRRWIESIRANHDPQAARLAAHFTLVFPADVASGEVAAEIAAIAGSARAIPFVIRCAKAVRDTFSGGGHVFLVPDEGANEIATLHDRLYSGVLRPHLREDIPFEPHITVAAGDDFGWCEAIAEGLNQDPRTRVGIVESLELVEIVDGTVSSTGRFILGNG
jgi:2'-5' RNA ligase